MKKIAIVSAVVVVVIVAIVIARNLKQKGERELNALLLRVQYDSCLEEADDLYNKNWNIGCKEQGKGLDCETLPRYMAEILNEELVDSRKECLDTYKTMTQIQSNS